jgi:hypothetical protein
LIFGVFADRYGPATAQGFTYRAGRLASAAFFLAAMVSSPPTVMKPVRTTI